MSRSETGWQRPLYIPLRERGEERERESGERRTIDELVSSAVEQWHASSRRRLPPATSLKTREERHARGVEDLTPRGEVSDADRASREVEEPREERAGGSGPLGPAPSGPAGDSPALSPGIFVGLPRRDPIISGAGDAGQSTPPMMQQLSVSVSRTGVIFRVLTWFYAGFLFFSGVLVDRLLRRDSVSRRAVRLRKTFERLGGTFIKVGQQMSMRLDLLPFEYCNELAKMLDKVKPFDVKLAVETIERTTKQPLTETFSSFDPEPIGSASLACVWQGTLKSGEHVAVKVRRPGIGEKFSADCTAFDWMLRACERLTLVRPGQFAGLRTELRNVLLEELNFRREARYTELFGLSVEENKQRYLGAPRVHFDLSSSEVLVTEFVSGIPLSEVLAVVDRKDPAGLARLAEMNIKPRDVAKHLLRATMLGIYENIIFHADPHPANVIVQEDSKLVLIDFGSCGSYTLKERRIMRQMQYYQAIGDVGGMVQAGIDLLEPLPPIDVESFAKKMEIVWWQSAYALKSKHTEWWERTQMAMWIHMIDLTREYQMPININTLRVVRATLLIDSAAGRLDPHYDMYKEYESFDKERGKLARERMEKLSDRLLEGAEDRNYQRLEQALDSANRFFYQLQRKLDNPSNRFTKMIDKSIYAQSIFIRSLVSWAFFTGVIVAVVAGVALLQRQPVVVADIVRLVLSSGWYLAAVAFGALLNVRRVLYRYDDIDV